MGGGVCLCALVKGVGRGRLSRGRFVAVGLCRGTTTPMDHAMGAWRYRSLSGLSGWFRRAMVVCLLINLFGLGLQGLDLYLGNDLQAGSLGSQAYLGLTTLMWEMLHVAYRAAAAGRGGDAVLVVRVGRAQHGGDGTRPASFEVAQLGAVLAPWAVFRHTDPWRVRAVGGEPVWASSREGRVRASERSVDEA